MLRPLLVLIPFVFAIAGAACVLNGQPTPPDGVNAGADASSSEDASPKVDETGNAADAGPDGRGDAFDPSPDGGPDAGPDAQGDGG